MSKKRLKFGDVLTQFVSLQHKRAVVRMILRLLEPFIPSDDGTPQQYYEDKTCLKPVVDAEAFFDIYAMLMDLERELDQQLSSLAGAEVSQKEGKHAVIHQSD